MRPNLYRLVVLVASCILHGLSKETGCDRVPLSKLHFSFLSVDSPTCPLFFYDSSSIFSIPVTPFLDFLQLYFFSGCFHVNLLVPSFRLSQCLWYLRIRLLSLIVELCLLQAIFRSSLCVLPNSSLIILIFSSLGSLGFKAIFVLVLLNSQT